MKRILSALIILPIALIVFIFGNKYVVDIFIGIIALRCIYELFHAFEKKGHHPVFSVGYIAALAICFLHIIPKDHALIYIGIIITLSIVILFLIAIIGRKKIDVVDIAITFFGICYVVIFSMFMSIVREMPNGKFYIWFIFIASWVTDVFAYLTGITIGKHHFTEVSPKKTIEGCIGGTVMSVIATIVYSIILNQFFDFNVNLLLISIIGFVLSIIGQIGDLSASVVKRYAGIKDYSNLIPGHGGMLDRIDSVIFIAPFAYFLLLLV